MISHIGKVSVGNYIKQLGQKGFKVFSEGSKNPLYTSMAKTPDQAVKEFINFSDNILSGNKSDSNVYHLCIIKDGMGKAPVVLSETYFQYNQDEELEPEVISGSPQYNTSSLKEMFGLMGEMINLVQPFSTQKAENQLLRQQLDDIDAEPEPEQNSTLTSIISAFAPQLLKQQGEQVALSGVETADGVKVDVLNKAIEKLLIADPDLPSDLMKLAELSETKPKFFHTLLATLRNM